MRICRRVSFQIDTSGTIHTVTGRVAWTLQKLLSAGESGIITAAFPGTRLSEYVRLLRNKGVHIETLRERHGGEFPGTHGRYVLRSRITVVSSRATNP